MFKVDVYFFIKNIKLLKNIVKKKIQQIRSNLYKQTILTLGDPGL